ncbi:ubiquitin carboxyl-terminal hydrolase MINDY-2 isoform X2 [Carettochelys insculpta]|uniref:ubiquitin carboxyl-terminal hydrolase MINDY-2 isoform X2 n=1 Tax=Carettochelys insculpta TaxID=44489 RepID=UPI003EB8932F
MRLRKSTSRSRDYTAGVQRDVAITPSETVRAGWLVCSSRRGRAPGSQHLPHLFPRARAAAARAVPRRLSRTQATRRGPFGFSRPPPPRARAGAQPAPCSAPAAGSNLTSRPRSSYSSRARAREVGHSLARSLPTPAAPATRSSSLAPLPSRPRAGGAEPLQPLLSWRPGHGWRRHSLCGASRELRRRAGSGPAMESLAQPPPPPGALKRGGGGAAGRIVPEGSVKEEAAASGRDGPVAAEEGGGPGGPSPPSLASPAVGCGKDSPVSSGSVEPAPESRRLAADCAEPAVPESPEAAPGGEGGSSGGDPSPPEEESRSLDSLESFSNLHSCCPSSSELNSDAEEVAAPAAAEDKAPASAGDGQTAAAQLLSASKERFPGQSVYHIKWVRWKEENTPIITQNENGPCPLLAIMNVLLLAWKVKLPPMMEIITAEQLMEYLGDYILDAKPKEISEIQRLNYEQCLQHWLSSAYNPARCNKYRSVTIPLNVLISFLSWTEQQNVLNMSDAMAILHKLQTGLDVNVKFTGVRVFEYTPECIVFDLLDIPLYHGWLVDPQIADIVKAVGNCSYNQLVEKIICCKQSDNSELVSEGFVAEQFLNNTATQLTYHGLCELTSAVQEGELCVFFRNNHFSTMTKYKGQLYLLVTDQGFLTEEKVVWESLHNVDGDGNFCDSEFHLRPPSDPETVYRGQQDQIDQDYLMALSLQQEQQSQDINWEQIPEGISDLELAKKLQEEEDRRASQYYQEQEQAVAAAAQVQVQGAASPASGRQSGSSERKRKEPREKEREKEKEKNSCVIL